jgi:hypothetical protein
MAAVFAPLKRPQDGRTELDRPAASAAELAAVQERDRRIADIKTQLAREKDRLRRAWALSGPAGLPSEALAAFKTPPENRSPRQDELVERHQAELDAEALSTPEARRRLEAIEGQIANLRAAIPDLRRGYFLFEPPVTPATAPPETHLLLRGSPSNPGPRVEPGVPTVLAARQPAFSQTGPTTRRRLALAKWLIDERNPLVARVIVNRVWQGHFGQGIVRSASDFGVMGTPPTHPELLDWLAHWFVHEADWSLKRLHRLVLTSRAYRLSKQINPDYARSDAENDHFWRFPYQRLEVEAIRDSMLAAAGSLRRTMHGPSVFLAIPPEALDSHADKHSIWPPFDEGASARRTVYAFVKRSLVVPMLEVLDLCDTTRSVERRTITSVPTQALTLLNGAEVNRQSVRLAERLLREAGAEPREQVSRLFALTLCRAPADDESHSMCAYLEQEASRVVAEGGRADAARREALVRLCRAVFNLNEFVYPD